MTYRFESKDSSKLKTKKHFQEYRKEYYLKNKKKIKAYYRKYYQENKDELLKKDAARIRAKTEKTTENVIIFLQALHIFVKNATEYLQYTTHKPKEKSNYILR